MKKIIAFILFALLLFLVFGNQYLRFDTTKDKRYTLSQNSLKVLEKIDKPLEIDVYLKGNFPAYLSHISKETETLLETIQKENSNISFNFIDPIEEKISLDTLQSYGLQASSISITEKGKLEQRLIFPWAVIKYEGYGDLVQLLETKDKISQNEQAQISIQNLEYLFISGIKKISEEKPKNIGYFNAHKTLNGIHIASFIQKTLQSYNIQPIFPLDSVEYTLEIKDLDYLKQFEAIIIAKPLDPFLDEEKLVLDQYLMNGGKMLWMLDGINAEKDSLFKNESITAFNYDLNLSDLFFSYGIRLKNGLVKDYKNAGKIKVQTGETQGNPEYSTLLWPYLPLGITEVPHSITRNINPVLYRFASSLDTLETENVKKTVLFQSSTISQIAPTPTQVRLEDVVVPIPDSITVQAFANNNQILSLLLEGEFTSSYSGRFERSTIQNFKEKSPNTQLIFIADGDIIKNDVYQGNPLPLGRDGLTDIQYGNAEFIANSLDYLLDDSNLIQLRNRNVELRLLDSQKILDHKSKWQFINLCIPILFLFLVFGIMFYIKKTKFT